VRESERLREKAEKIESIAREAWSEAEQQAYQEIAESYRLLAAEAERSESRNPGGAPSIDDPDSFADSPAPRLEPS